MLRKTLILIAVLAIITSGLAAVFATADDGNSIDFMYIMSTSTELDITSSGKACCTARISCYPGTDSNRISAYLQRYENGTWTTVQSWVKNTTGSEGYMYNEKYISSGYQYRLKVYFYAYEGTDSESAVKISYDTY